MAKKSDNAVAKRKELVAYLEAHPDESFKAVPLLAAADVEYPKSMLRELLTGHSTIYRQGKSWWYRAKK